MRSNPRHRYPSRLGWVTLGVLAIACQASPLQRDETVVIFPTSGCLDRERAHWKVEVHGWVFEREHRTVSLFALRSALGLGGLEYDEEAEERFAERARWFLTDNERGKRVTVTVGHREFRMPRSDANGHFSARIEIPVSVATDDPGASQIMSVRAAGGTREATTIIGSVHLLAPVGLSVISDIDDTIKVSGVGDREALLRSTFLEPFRPVPGMAELYARWATNPGASFHYVTASPWQLYPDLLSFVRSNGFPEGTFHMKLFRWKDRSFLELFRSPERYKLEVIEPLLRQFPERRYVLVGDSGERDPEVYGELARRHPKQVRHLLIRDVTGDGMDAKRSERAFAGVSEGVAEVFSDPGRLRDLLGPPPPH